jgi:large subunit ribosomal protein L2
MKTTKIFPYNNSARHHIKLDNNLLTKNNNIVKFLFKKFNKKNGRSSHTGHITVRHKSSGTKRKFHVLNSLQFYYGFNLCQMYCAFHNTFVSLNFDVLTKSFFKTISTNKIFPGSIITSNFHSKNYSVGCRTRIEFLPVGSIIHLIGLNNNVTYSCSAGTFCQIIEKKKNCKIRLPSGKITLIPNYFFATLGTVSNFKFKNIIIAKAGRNRSRGIRPCVRGIAMNPVDHPHGGRGNKGMHPVTPWGIPTKNRPTKKKGKKRYE